MVDIATMRQTINEGNSRFVCFNNVFWKFVKTEVGITHIYEEKQSYLKKQVSFEERQKKIEMLLQRADFDDDKLNPSDEALAKWSHEALELSQIIKKLGLNKDICSEEYLFKFFETFFAQKNNIQSMDSQLLRFENLSILNLTNNKIKTIQNLPPNLTELNLTGNLVEQIEVLRTPLRSLIHLGVAYNLLKTENLVVIAQNFPNLFCLDAAFNELCEFSGACQALQDLEGIKMLYLNGNPLALTPNYRDILKQRFQNLRILDGTQAFSEVEENAKKKHIKRVTARLAHLGDIPKDAFKIPEADLISIQDNVVLELQFRLLDNISGVYINDTNCQQLETLNLDEVPEERKSSLYWLKYTNHLGEEITTEKKAWIEHFQVDSEKGTGKTDMCYTLKIEERPTNELRDWLESDLFVSLHCSQPKFQLKLLEENSDQVKDIVLGADNLPEIEEKHLGIMRIDTSKLVKKTDLAAHETDYHKFNRFYSSEFLEKPEFMFRNHLIALKDSDMELLQQALANEEAEESKRNLLASQEGNLSQGNIKGKDAKGKDAKKAPPKGGAAEADKNAPKPIEIEYAEDVPIEQDFMLIEKTFNQGKSKPAALPKRSAKTPASGGPMSVGTGGAAGSQANSAVAPEDALAAKKQARLQELHTTYDLIRALPFTMAIVMKLNYVPPPPPPVEEVVESQVDPKSSLDKNAKGKGKGKK